MPYSARSAAPSRKAADVGANAIILDAISEPSGGAERKGRAVAIYMLNPAATSDAAAKR